MSGLYTRLISGLVFPLHERLKHHSTVAVRRRMEQSQWWPAEALAQLQADRLRALLIEVGAKVPYYRDLFGRLGVDLKALRLQPQRT